MIPYIFCKYLFVSMFVILRASKLAVKFHNYYPLYNQLSFIVYIYYNNLVKYSKLWVISLLSACMCYHGIRSSVSKGAVRSALLQASSVGTLHRFYTIIFTMVGTSASTETITSISNSLCSLTNTHRICSLDKHGVIPPTPCSWSQEVPNHSEHLPTSTAYKAPHP